MTHTPGPWTYTVEDNGDDFQLMGGEVYIIGGCGCCGSPFMCGPYEANARLIAAAPEMLEALYEAEEYFDNRADADHDETGFVPNKEMTLLVSIRAAIAKATGSDK